MLNILGLMVVVPSNPEGNFFQLADAMVNLLGMDKWTSDPSKLFQARIYQGIVQFLASQTQPQLLYRIPYVDSND